MHRNGRSMHRNGRSMHRNGRLMYRNGRSMHRNGRSMHRNGFSGNTKWLRLTITVWFSCVTWNKSKEPVVNVHTIGAFFDVPSIFCRHPLKSDPPVSPEICPRNTHKVGSTEIPSQYVNCHACKTKKKSQHSLVISCAENGCDGKFKSN